jgi:hypothetical protein
MLEWRQVQMERLRGRKGVAVTVSGGEGTKKLCTQHSGAENRGRSSAFQSLPI